jgi:hypothetical protein
MSEKKDDMYKNMMKGEKPEARKSAEAYGMAKSIARSKAKSNLPAPRFEKPAKKNLPYSTGSKATDAPRGTGYAGTPPRSKKNSGR